MLHVRRILSRTLSLLAILVMVVGSYPLVTHAAASMSVNSPSTFAAGSNYTISITVNTGGQSANAFEGRFTYPTSLFQGVSGSMGSACTLPITVPDPSGGVATFSCGKPSGFNGSGTVVTISLKAIATGTGVLGLSNCQVLANDGAGTNITGGCTGASITVEGSTYVSTPTPTAPPTTATSTPTAQATASTGTSGRTPRPGTSPTPTKSPTPTPTPSGPTVAPEQANNAPDNTDPTPPPVQELGAQTPTPTPQETESSEPQRESRTVAQAIQDILKSSRDLSSFRASPAGVIAVMITTFPFLVLIFFILLLAYRLYTMERRRRRTLDRLFEMELSELAALEGKLDLLGEKGIKGREQYREEFKKAKENILRQLKPDFNKPLDKSAPTPATPDTQPEK